MEYSLQQAADAAGVGKSTIYRACKSGKLSKNESGKIDASELARVYPDTVKGGTTGPDREPFNGTERHGHGTANETAEIKVLEVKLNAAETLAEDREKTIDHLRSELEGEKQERRQVQSKLTAILTDQRPAEAVSSTPKKMPDKKPINYPLWALVFAAFGVVIWLMLGQGG
jgi:hypothetical protein